MKFTIEYFREVIIKFFDVLASWYHMPDLFIDSSIIDSPIFSLKILNDPIDNLIPIIYSKIIKITASFRSNSNFILAIYLLRLY
jgi:hypothetical protein